LKSNSYIEQQKNNVPAMVWVAKGTISSPGTSVVPDCPVATRCSCPAGWGLSRGPGSLVGRSLQPGAWKSSWAHSSV